MSTRQRKRPGRPTASGAPAAAPSPASSRPRKERTGAPPSAHQRDVRDEVPDVRDGLTRIERIILHTLHRLQAEYGERGVPSAVLYGHVVEQVPLRPEELQEILARLGAR